MTLGIKVRGITTEIGPGSIMHGLFSTISANLEVGGWGARFPILFGQFYQGTLKSSDSSAALTELATIRAELASLPPNKVVWDIEDPSIPVPREYKPNPNPSSLANYFVTIAGRDLLFEIGSNIEVAAEIGANVELVSYSSPIKAFGK